MKQGRRAGIVEAPIPAPGEIPGVTALALDFETATADRASPCAIGLAWIANGKVVRSAQRLIRPRGNRFDPFNVALHGIRPEMVADKPEFPEIWRDVRPHLQGVLVLAHNAAFDMAVLAAVLHLHGVTPPGVESLCTVKVARRVWPALPHHRLSDLAHHLKIGLNHHDARSDAEVCAKIALEAASILGLPDVSALPLALGKGFVPSKPR